jgi:hypothetical protein
MRVVQRPLAKPIPCHRPLPARHHQLTAGKVTHPRSLDIDLAGMKADLAARAAPAIVAFLSLESAPRAYRLKASNAAPPFFNIRRDIASIPISGAMINYEERSFDLVGHSGLSPSYSTLLIGLSPCSMVTGSLPLLALGWRCSPRLH